ncbi:unnamed protein product [Eretmochelys imbricata]
MQVIQVVLIARVLKLLRIVRMKRYIEEWDELTDLIGNTSYIIFEIVLQFGILYIVVHWYACIQFYTENLLQFPVNSWVYQQNLTMKDIQEYISYRKLPQDLCQRIFTYYDIRYQGRWYNEEEILNEMSEPLKEERT